MKIFFCDCSENTFLFFESVVCTVCARLVGYCPDRDIVAAFSPANVGEEVVSSGGGSDADDREISGGDLWVSERVTRRYRQCQNYSQHQVCNWMVPEDDPNPLCVACRLNEMIPDLGRPENIEYWRKLEQAKRHCLYGVLRLGLPLVSRREDPARGLSYRFLADRDPGSEFTEPMAGQQPVMTGHDNGIITINLAEADDIARTRARVQLGETYRTPLGHFRHEIGHYYWQRLVAGQPDLLERFREYFGDERIDYEEAKARHYGSTPDKATAGQPAAAEAMAAPDAADAPAVSWTERFISQYAAMHPWEDWAECWAHYLHMLDTLETAQSYALELQGHSIPSAAAYPATAGSRDLEPLLKDWIQLAIALNSLNRSMGKRDPYPFVLTEPVKAKLRLIDDIVMRASG